MFRQIPFLALIFFTPLFPASAAPLNDTGITFCGDATTNTASCARVAADTGTHPRQDARYGRDAAAAAGTLTKIGGGDAGCQPTATSRVVTEIIQKRRIYDRQI